MFIFYQEVVSKELWQLHADDVVVEGKETEGPLVSGHLCGTMEQVISIMLEHHSFPIESLLQVDSLWSLITERTLSRETQSEEMKTLTPEDALLLQHCLARIELQHTAGGVMIIDRSHSDEGKQRNYLPGSKDDLVSSESSRCLVCIGHIWNEKDRGRALQPSQRRQQPQGFLIFFLRNPDKEIAIKAKNSCRKHPVGGLMDDHSPQIHLTVCILGRIRKQSLKERGDASHHQVCVCVCVFSYH